MTNFAVGKLKLFFSALYIGQNVVVRLVCPFDKTLVELDFSFTAFKLLLELLNFLQHTFSFLLLLLKTICQKQALLDSSFGCCRCLRDGLNESIADVIGTISCDLIVLGDMHDGLVELALNHLVVGKALFAYSQVSLDVSVALPRRAL